MTTIRYGISNSTERQFAPNTTIQDILSNTGLLASLNAPQGVVAVSGGMTLDPTDLVSSFNTITLEKQASSKA